jgi:SAM-dependent methyltransferase
VKEYNNLFFDYVDSGAMRSAEVFTRLLMPELKAQSMLDVGCGRGGWASRWKAAGCTSVLGIDGDYVDRKSLYVSEDEFEVVDLNKPFDLGRRFNLVQSLEVAEHLRPETSETFVRSLVNHGDIVLFSAAIPGQGGTQHINERPLEFWRGLFAQHGYRSYDFIRPLTSDNRQVEPWYRFNSIIYASDAGRQKLSEPIRKTEVPVGKPLAQVAPASWRMRCTLLKSLPVSLIDKFAAINAKVRMVTTPRP